MPITNIFLDSEGQQNQVVKYYIDFDRITENETGQPLVGAILKQLYIAIKRNSELEEPFYIEWHLTPKMKKTLSIGFYDTGQLVREISIENAYLVSYDQVCEVPGLIEERLVISPERMKIDGVSFKRKWA